MYLPAEIPGARVLITVKTYPKPSNKYSELVCTAGFLASGEWIRLYPVPFRDLPFNAQYEKYNWITLDLVKTDDFRPESYRPKYGAERITVGGKLDTKDCWAERKKYALREVFTSMKELIALARGPERKSLATLKPKEIIDVIVEDDEREWKPEWRNLLLQYNLFDRDEKGEGKTREVVEKIPYKFFYKFITEGDQQPRKLQIEDWELGSLYRNCLERSGGEEKEAIRLVKQKFFDDFVYKRDLHLFVGTTREYHLRSLNPFIVVGVFYPSKPELKPEKKSRTPLNAIKTDGIEQQPLFDI